jgi:site-specific DNA-methyltransferase (adenine-specific)
MAVNIEDAGFEIRDMIAWVYGSGFPKSLDVSKAIDKAAGAEREVVGFDPVAAKRTAAVGTAAYGDYKGQTGDVTAPATDAARQWQGWGTALKPALEPITVARKPLVGTVAANVLAHGTGALNIDGCRVAGESTKRENHGGTGDPTQWRTGNGGDFTSGSDAGRWPANLIHDGSDEVLAGFPWSKDGVAVGGKGRSASIYGTKTGGRKGGDQGYGQEGSAARFFYCAKASKSDRNEGCAHLDAKQYSHDGRETPIENAYQRNNSVRQNNHPTVKPTDLMAYLCRLVTPPGGVVLDPFMGSGSTGKAAMREGFRFIGCELSPEYMEIANARIAHALYGDLA